ncbi:MAG: hypothetical protein ACK4WH_03185 [Phycisphaerales bacterium]
MAINLQKKTALLESIEGEGDVVTAAAFFDGNDDPASFAVNAGEGEEWLALAKKTLEQIAGRPGVRGVWCVVTDMMDGEDDCWLYTDTVLVKATASIEDVEDWSVELAPNEVLVVDPDETPQALGDLGDEEWVYALWWD